MSATVVHAAIAHAGHTVVHTAVIEVIHRACEQYIVADKVLSLYESMSWKASGYRDIVR